MIQHIDDRTLYIKSVAGIGNRLGPILFATRLLNLGYFDRLVIKWEYSNCSQFQLSDIFDINYDKIQIITGDFEPPSKWSHCRSLESRSASFIPWRYYNSNCYFGFLPFITENDRKYSNNEIIQQVNESFQRYLTIKRPILEKANESEVNDYIGIHCRRTDVDLNYIPNFDSEKHGLLLSKLVRARDRLYSDELNKIIDENDKIFIASDDQITKDYYKSVFKNSIYRKSKLPIDMRKIHPDPEKYGRWVQAFRHTGDIIDAFIELIILSRCKLVITDHCSTYALTARYLSGVEVYWMRAKEPILIRVKK